MHDGLPRGRPPSRPSTAAAARTSRTARRPPRPCSRLDLARVVGLLRRPVPERQPETVRQGGDLVVLGASSGTSTTLSTSRSASGTRRRFAVAERPRRVEDLQRPAAQRDPVLALRLHPRHRDRPHRAGRSISSHVASRTSPDRAAVSTRNSNASLTAACAEPFRTVSMPAATPLCGNACRSVTMSFCGPSTGTTRSQGWSFPGPAQSRTPAPHGCDGGPPGPSPP